MVNLRLICLLTLSVSLGSGCRLYSEDASTDKLDPTALFPVVKNGKWGYINGAGQVAIEPQFEKATAFVDGLAPVRINGKWGYIDIKGNTVIQPLYSGALHFSEGTAVVAYQAYLIGTSSMSYFSRAVGVGWNRHMSDVPSADDDCLDAYGWDAGMRFAYIDKKGKIIFDQALDYACKFHEGLAAISRGHKGAYIDPAGKIVLETPFKFVDSFSEGLARVAVKGDGAAELDQWGYIDKSGKIVIEPQFDQSRPFSEGRAAVEPYDKAGHQALDQLVSQASKASQMGIIAGNPTPIQYYDFIDNTGKIVIHTGSLSPSLFEGGIAAVRDGFIKLDGTKFLNCESPKICNEPFFDGRALFSVTTADRSHPGIPLYTIKVGYMDQSGNIVIPLNFDGAESFQNGLALVRIGHITGFDNGEAQFSDLKIGYINRAGKYVWKPTN